MSSACFVAPSAAGWLASVGVSGDLSALQDATVAKEPVRPLCSTSSNGSSTVTVRNAEFQFVRIPVGAFQMGSTSWGMEAARETPLHRVKISRAFEFGRTEVTVGQFREFVEATAYRTDAEKLGWAWGRDPRGDAKTNLTWRTFEFPQTEEHPVICSWYDAQAFCRWLSVETRTTFRLPSEAEWEYACRAGVPGEFSCTDDQCEWDLGWHLMNSGVATHPVGRKPANRWGLFDIHGNVWEWCADLYHADYTGAPFDGSAWVTGTGQIGNRRLVFRMARGGAFNRQWICMRSACRQAAPEDTASNFGFRMVREIEDCRTDPFTSPQPSRTEKD